MIIAVPRQQGNNIEAERTGDDRALASGEHSSCGRHGSDEGLAANPLELLAGAGTVGIDHHVGVEWWQRHGLIDRASTRHGEERGEARGAEGSHRCRGGLGEAGWTLPVRSGGRTGRQA